MTFFNNPGFTKRRLALYLSMANSESIVKELLDSLPQEGTVEYISIRPKRRSMPEEVSEVLAGENGLEGDHFASEYSDKRQVTLIQKEHLDAVASILQKDKIDPLLTRRNIVVSKINLLALRNRKFQIGDAILEFTGDCYPCSRMEENLGAGGYNAMRGHGGITARIIKPGFIRLSSKVKMLKD